MFTCWAWGASGASEAKNRGCFQVGNSSWKASGWGSEKSRKVHFSYRKGSASENIVSPRRECCFGAESLHTKRIT